MSSSTPRQLPDELVLKIISHLGTLNEVVRYSSLMSKRWKEVWRSIGGGILDFDKSDNIRAYIPTEEQLPFANTVDQALTSLASHRNLDGLRIGFDFYGMAEQARRWIEFGLTKTVKELTLISSSPYLPPLTLDSLAKHDLSRLEVLEFHGMRKIPRAVVQHILCNCPSLRQFALRNCSFSELGGAVLVINVQSSHNNLQSLSLDLEAPGSEVRIELVSAPNLHTFKFRGSHVEFGDNLPRLREAWFSGQWIRETSSLPWSRAQFEKFAPRLDRLGLQLGPNRFRHRLVSPVPEWLLFEKLRFLGLDLFINTCFAPSSLVDCTVLLIAAPVLRQLTIRFANASDMENQEWRGSSAAESSLEWKHHALEVLRLHGVHRDRTASFFVSARRRQLELAACIIMRAPSLKQVLIDTRHPSLIRRPAAEFRLPHEVDEDICEARMELDTQLQGRSASPHVHFTYR
ncbi:unnamed protein product [Linum trigynum]|uniref:F-box domain-containing protein n=1 Tax=Linum trigynum TaxID=586398 RepID=A0AAV2DQJ9_9ROSI